MGTLSLCSAGRKLTPTIQDIHNSHRMGRGKCVPKGWHIPKGLIRAALPWGCSPGNRHLPKGLGLGRRFLQIPGLGNPCEPAEVFDGGDGAC